MAEIKKCPSCGADVEWQHTVFKCGNCGTIYCTACPLTGPRQSNDLRCPVCGELDKRKQLQ